MYVCMYIDNFSSGVKDDRVPTGQGKLEKVREFGWSGKVRENA